MLTKIYLWIVAQIYAWAIQRDIGDCGTAGATPAATLETARRAPDDA